MDQMVVLLESQASERARALSLTYYGFGRYGRNGEITHVVHAGRLEPVHKTYLSSKGEPVLLHYTHLEDQMVQKGSEGARHAIDVLYNLIRGQKHVQTQTKIDGAPSLFFGRHPKTGKFFVATKSLFNATPKINYTHEDIDRNHGIIPGLAAKLHAALEHLPKVYRGKKVLQGDVMFSKGDVDEREIEGKKYYTFRPNIIRNAVVSDSALGKKIGKAQFGFAVHTQYNENGERQPADESEVGKHDNVFLMPISSNSGTLQHHEEALSDVGRQIAGTSRQSFDVVSHPMHQALVMQYFNYAVKQQEPISCKGYLDYIKGYLQRIVDKAKKPETKKKKQAELDGYVAEVTANKEHFDSVFNVHRKVSALKDALIDDLNKNQDIKRFFDNDDTGGMDSTGPEGYVAIGHHGTYKLVKRSGFSFQNFIQQKNWGPKKNSSSAVVTLGRMSPPHIEHTHLIDAVVQHAKKNKADPYIYVSHTQDNKKNPLNAQEKIDVLRAAHPALRDIFHATNEKMPSMINILHDLYEKGYKNVDVVMGDGRVEDFDFLKKYNGKRGEDGSKFYQFDKLNIVSRHDIHNTRKGTSDGVHASDLRAAALAGDYEKFKAGMDPNVPEQLVRKTMELIKKRLSEDVRERYFEGKLLHEGDLVINKKTETLLEVVTCGTNYLNVVDGKGILSRMWVEDAVLANQLREDFDALRKCKSLSNQIAFVGYKTRHFTKGHYTSFKPMIREGINKFVLLSLIRDTDQLLKEILTINSQNYGKVRSLYEKTGKFLARINTLSEHKYRFDLVEKLNEFELNEGFELTGLDKHRAANLIAKAIGSEIGETLEKTVNTAVAVIKEETYTVEAKQLIGKMLNLATHSGIKWDKTQFSKQAQREMGLK